MRYGVSSNRGPTSLSSTLRCFSTLNVWCRKLIKSFWLSNVKTRVAYDFGTGNKYRRTSFTRTPNLVVKFSKIRCGYCYDIVPTFSISWRVTRLWMVKMTVGPSGKCEMVMLSGTPWDYWSTMTSLKFSLRAASINWFTLKLPRFIRTALGITRRTYFANYNNFCEALREVVTNTRGSSTPALAYSSSTVVVSVCVWASSNSLNFFSIDASLRKWPGNGVELVIASRNCALRA